ncbi:MAG TPA: sulfite exporter TauE/SafE family protein [Candidatus Baltobacteraceae bacterium]|nr:sulfite exporter TauE/SafE family protein [Candidatus Baltobacteraceae bacterium]
MLSIAVYFLCGLVFGYVGGLFGIGGGLIGIPVLGVFFGYSEQAAQGTAMVMIVPNVLLGLWNYFHKVGFDVRLAVTLAVSAVPCTYVAAHFATTMPSGLLRMAFAIFIAAIAAQMAWRTFGPQRAVAKHHYPWPLAALIGAVGGTFSGLFGVGGAIFAVPMMSMFFGLSQVVAQGMGLALVAPGTVVSIVTYGFARDVAWIPGIALALGGAIAVPHGVNLAKRLPERVLRALFIALMLAAAFGLAVRSSARAATLFAPSGILAAPAKYERKNVTVIGIVEDVTVRAIPGGVVSQFALCDSRCINVVEFTRPSFAPGQSLTVAGTFHTIFSNGIIQARNVIIVSNP